MHDEDMVAEVSKAQSNNTVELEGDLVIIRLAGNQDSESTNKMFSDLKEVVKMIGYKPNILLDASFTGVADSSARKLVMKYLDSEVYNYQAAFGFNDAIRIMVNLMIKAVKSKNRLAVFKTEAECRAWLSKHSPDKANTPKL